MTSSTFFYLITFILGLLVLECVGRDYHMQSPVPDIQSSSRQPLSKLLRSMRGGNNMQLTALIYFFSNKGSVMVRCMDDGVCIDSQSCPWNRLLLEDVTCMQDHNSHVCCRVQKVKSSLDSFFDNL
ncbi:hypothetical protein B5X24_HaOG213268 [Helicoverpa armigera]|nr:hypothetical protein B5X24_HaOG213268 [Helicoverpa armigera]